MMQLPEEHELIALFESEPRLADRDVPWVYNSITFQLDRDEDKILCEIDPAYGEFKLHWEQAGVQRANLKLNEIASLVVHIAKGDEHLVATSASEHPGTMLKLRLKPFVCVEFVNWHEQT